MRLTPKRVCQWAGLALFVGLLAVTAFPLPDWLPAGLFPRLDPLVLAESLLAGRALVWALWPAAALLLTSLVLGRFFCGWLCPLGTCVDLADSRLRRGLGRAPERPWLYRIKYALLAAMLAAALAGVSLVFAAAALPLATRLFGLLLHPLFNLAGETILSPLRLQALDMGLDSLAYLRLPERRYETILFLFLFFGTLFGLGRLSPRFWCRHLCPSGALFGLFSRRPLIRRRVSDECVQCGKCRQRCPMGAIPADVRTTRHEECIVCQTCVRVCPTGAVAFRARPFASADPAPALPEAREPLGPHDASTRPDSPPANPTLADCAPAGSPPICSPPVGFSRPDSLPADATPPGSLATDFQRPDSLSADSLTKNSLPGDAAQRDFESSAPIEPAASIPSPASPSLPSSATSAKPKASTAPVAPRSPGSPGSPGSPVASSPVADLGRRGFLLSGAAGLGLGAAAWLGLASPLRLDEAEGALFDASLLRPPGSLPEREFLARCVRCGLCMRVCPSNGLQPIWLKAGWPGLFSPVLVPRRGACEPLCNACGQVCPTGAVAALPLAEKQQAKLGTARVLRRRCLAWEEQRRCLVCDEVCPYDAIVLRQEPGNPVGVPFVLEERCAGCGLCEHHCPLPGEKAIVVEAAGALRLSRGGYAEAAKREGLDLSLRGHDGQPGSLTESWSEGGSNEGAGQGASGEADLPPGFSEPSASSEDSGLPPGFDEPTGSSGSSGLPPGFTEPE